MSQTVVRRILPVICIACVLSLVQPASSQSEATKPETQEQPASHQAEPGKQEPKEPSAAKPAEEPVAIPNPSLPAVDGAWQLLQAGAKSEKSGDRVAALHALGLIPDDSRAAKLAEAALQDEKPEVRSAAAEALGNMRYKSSVPKLEKMLDDPDPKVVLSAAHALVQMKDDAGYEVYYEILTGERKAGPGLIASQKAMLKDPKKLAELGFHQGLGFVPFGGISYEAFKMLTKDDVSPLRAAAAKTLARDPDPGSLKALIKAAGDKSWLVRAAAIEGLAQRGDPAALPTVALYMYDDKTEIKYVAGGAVVRLSALKKRSNKNKTEQIPGDEGK
jgi:HEAT repeat protein